MQIYVGYLDEIGEDELERLQQECKVQVYEDELVFSLSKMEYFEDATDTLFYILLGERPILLDLDMQFEDWLKTWDIPQILFYNCFDKFMDELQERFDRLYDWNVENYEECKEIYFGFLNKIAKSKY